MARARRFESFVIHGHLIGTMGSPNSKAQGIVTLRGRIRKAGPETMWRARDYLEVLTDTQAAHQDLLTIQKKLEDAAAAEA